MTRSPVYLTDLACSERLTIWTIRRLAGEASSAPQSACGRQIGMFLPCFREEFMAVAEAFHDAVTRMAALEIPSLDIRSGSALAITATEYNLLLATEAAQNERDAEVQSLLKPLLPFPALLAGLTSAITTLGACLAGAGYWLSHHASKALARRPSYEMVPVYVRPRATTAAALSVARWRDFNMDTTHVSWPMGSTHHDTTSSLSPSPLTH
ncbi:hypothetical protein [Acetobacter indonesiensis]|jgi:hypothetical protein|uniref:hypothetical protein n=1 Tax=Acetobacter indonesiensis TaxID=104101 RepID=UPI000A3C325B|nr:hypothetical protein [Acetobacter indonesiensis]MCI1437249.1 hypothetical protein [Acetobacter indonesiensis]MCI1546333.1 hypothetical protein [Acetobacter indonesiensis]MCI1765677.1 hypothetical protein [Acetobacter indonesiensis]